MRDWRRHVRDRLPPLRLPPEREAEIVDELALQLEQDCADAVAGGASERDAAERALARFPAWEALAAEIEAAELEPPRHPSRHPSLHPPLHPSRNPPRRPPRRSPRPPAAAGRARPLAGIVGDLRHACRLLRHGPAFAAVAIATLAFGIGVNTAIFTVVDAVVVRALPFPAADRLMAVETRMTGQPESEPWTSAADFFDLRQRARSFASLAAISPVWNLVLTTRAAAQRLECLFVSADFFRTLGIRPALGRGFLASEDDPARPQRVVILGHAFWRQRYGARRDVLGKTLDLDGEPHAIVGVLPAGFRYPGQPLLGTTTEIDLWLPLAANQLTPIPQRSLRFLKVIGRRRPDAPAAQARRELRALGDRLAEEHPDSDRGFAVDAQPLAAQVKGHFRSSLLLLLGAVGFVLLMACANVANLVLARNAARRRELTVRAALGAPGARLLRQLLAEGLVLAALGGALGLALAHLCLRALLAAAPAGLIPDRRIALDPRSLLFTAAVTLGCAVAAGVLPGWRLLRLELAASLRDSARALTAGHHRLRGVLVAFEVAVALTLLVGAGLLVRSFARLLDVDPGFTPGRLVRLSTQTPPAARTAEQRTAVYEAIAERLRAVPGVVSVGAVSRLPLMGSNLGSWLLVEGRAAPPGERPEVEYRVATPSYFATMGIALRAGRLFDARDASLRAPVALINQRAARTFWPGTDPVGKRIKLGADTDRKPWIAIAGVVADVRHFGLDAEPRPEVYLPFAHSPLFAPILVVRTAADPAPLVGALGAAVRAAVPGLPVYDVSPMRELVAASTAQRRFLMGLLAAFAAAALLLAALGVYGIAAQAVVQRTREIGLRMALGASPAAALRLVLADGLRAILPGLAAGAAAAAGLTRAMRGALFAVSPLDPLSFAAAALVLGACALLACYAPARRATRVDPLVALRHD